jgi:hypothetical protein
VTAGAGGSPGCFPRSLSAVRAVWRGAVRALFVWAACSIAALPSSLGPSIAKAAIRGSRFFQLKSGVRARDGHAGTKKVDLVGPDKRLAGYENFKRLPLPHFLLAFSSLVLASVDMGVDSVEVSLYSFNNLCFQGTNTGDFSDYFDVQGDTLVVVPEPSTALLLGSGLAGLLSCRKRRRSSATHE